MGLMGRREKIKLIEINIERIGVEAERRRQIGFRNCHLHKVSFLALFYLDKQFSTFDKYTIATETKMKMVSRHINLPAHRNLFFMPLLIVCSSEPIKKYDSQTPRAVSETFSNTERTQIQFPIKQAKIAVAAAAGEQRE